MQVKIAELELLTGLKFPDYKKMELTYGDLFEYEWFDLFQITKYNTEFDFNNLINRHLFQRTTAILTAKRARPIKD